MTQRRWQRGGSHDGQTHRIRCLHRQRKLRRWRGSRISRLSRLFRPEALHVRRKDREESPSSCNDRIGERSGVFTAILERLNATSPTALPREGFMKQRLGKLATTGRAARLASAAFAVGCPACRQRGRMGAADGSSRTGHRADPTAAAVVNAKALERLNEMGAYLRSLKAFTVDAQVTVEEVLDSGQKVENAHSIDIAARRPDMLRVSTRPPLSAAARSITTARTSRSSRRSSTTTARSPRPRRSARPWKSRPRSMASSSRWPICS